MNVVSARQFGQAFRLLLVNVRDADYLSASQCLNRINMLLCYSTTANNRHTQCLAALSHPSTPLLLRTPRAVRSSRKYGPIVPPKTIGKFLHIRWWSCRQGISHSAPRICDRRSLPFPATDFLRTFA